MADIQIQSFTNEISSGNVSNTPISGILIVGSECPLLCGFISTTPGTDETATAAITISAGGTVLETIEVPIYPAKKISFVIPLIYPFVSGEEQLFYSTEVTGTDGSYSLYVGVK